MTSQGALSEPAAGVVLAGGASRRMGRDKATLEFAGDLLLRRVVERVRAAVERVVVVGPASLRAVVPGVPVITDRVPGLGPLGGLAVALDAVEAPWLFVAGCDMPLIVPALVRAMLGAAHLSDDTQVIVLRTTRGVEPLHAVYARSCAPVVAARLIGRDHSLAGLLSQLTVREFPADLAAALDPRGVSTFNANTPADWARAQYLMSRESAAGWPPK